jgi:Spy/CpxP family protein refolding chaperone
MNQAFRVLIVFLAFVGIFLAGAITGGVLTAKFMERQARQHELARQRLIQTVTTLRQQLQREQAATGRPAAWRAPSPDQYGTRLMERFIEQIQPTPEERAKIRPLVDQAAENLRHLRRDTANRAESILVRLDEQIAAVLTPEQRARFNQTVNRWREAFQRFNRDMQQRWRERQEDRGQEGPAPPDRGGPAPAPAGP